MKRTWATEPHFFLKGASALSDLIQEAILELGVTVESLYVSSSAAETEALLDGIELPAEERQEITGTLVLGAPRIDHEHKLILINAYKLSSARDVLFAAFHELRHLWQEQEGWQRGNPWLAKDVLSPAGD